MNKLIATLLLAMPAFVMMQAETPLYVGGDISLLQKYEDKNVRYYDQQGSRIDDVLLYLAGEKVNWNAVRVRLFVNPDEKGPDGQYDPQVCQNLAYVTRFCQRVKAAGLTLMLDFHYSDTWADPSNQWIPAAWATLNDDELADTLYTYTRNSLQALVEAGAVPDFIQIGNEISYGMLWSAEVNRSSNTNRCYTTSPEENWERFRNLLSHASLACREVCPDAQIIIHSERAGKKNVLQDFFTRLAEVDYDVIGLSYYPFWHNSLGVLSESLDMLAQYFPGKPVQIVETAYYYQWQPAVGGGIDYDFSSTWPITPDGQAAFTRDLIQELKGHSNVNGLYWWFPEENGNGPDDTVLTGWINRGLWNDNNHKALPALYVLQQFIGKGTDLGTARTESDGELSYYNLQGQRLRQPLPGVPVIVVRP